MKTIKKIISSLMVFAMMLSVSTGYSFATDNSDVSIVQDVSAATIKISSTKKSVYVKKSFTLKVTGTKKTVKWSSSNKKIATVNSEGKVTGVKKGTCTITAKVGNKTYKCKVTVNNPTLNKTSVSITKGKTYALKVTGGGTITWSSSNKKVATVTSKGVVKGIKAGTATITAKTNGVTLKCKVTIKNNSASIAITNIKISTTNISMETGNTKKLSAIIIPDNTTQSKTVTWSSSNTDVATVSSDGTVTAKSAGTATITAKSSNGLTSQATVTVKAKEVAITNITLNNTNKTLTEGDSFTLSATISPSNTTQSKTVTWSSSNANVATVSNGKVTAKSKGTAVITAKTSNGLTAKCTVTVNSKTNNDSGSTNDTTTTVAITSVNLNKTSLSLKIGNTATLSATVSPSNTTQSKTITWKSGNAKIATVDSNGKVTAVSSGSTYIYAKASNKVYAKCSIDVAAQYDYDLEFLNAKDGVWYTDKYVIMHIKTNNLNSSSNKDSAYCDVALFNSNNEMISTWATSKTQWDDIHYDNTNYEYTDNKVKDGFVLNRAIKNAGTYTIKVLEYNPSTNKDIEVCSKKITIKDYDTEYDNWLKSIISQLKINQMTSEIEKANAIGTYVYNNFEYAPSVDYDGNELGYKNVILTTTSNKANPIWVTKCGSCITVNSVLADLLDEAGFKDVELSYAGYNDHYNVKVTINGKTTTKDSSKSGDSNRITISYLDEKW